MKFELTGKNKFFLLGSLVFFLVSVTSSVLTWFIFAQLSFLAFGPLSGLGAFVHGLVGVAGVVFGLILGTLVALIINLKIGKKWMKDFGWSEGEQKAERTRLTCLSFIVFLIMLWGLIVVIARI